MAICGDMIKRKKEVLRMAFAKLLTTKAFFQKDSFAACRPEVALCGPDYGTDCMPECDPSDGSDDCDPYYP